MTETYMLECPDGSFSQFAEYDMHGARKKARDMIDESNQAGDYALYEVCGPNGCGDRLLQCIMRTNAIGCKRCGFTSHTDSVVFKHMFECNAKQGGGT